MKARLELSRAKHRSLSGHPRIAQVVASWVPFYEYGEARIFKADRAPDDVVAQRRADFARLSDLYRRRFPETMRVTAEATGLISDLQFTEAYRVPFQFSSYVRRHLPVGAFLQSSSGVTTTDLDGNSYYDLTGSYGVNLFGYDFYKECIDSAIEHVRALGPVLGSYHPVVAENAARLVHLSGMDEVSFHMSGTEAVMQAVRLARYHTRRTHLVRFCGAYHGWWGDVQPGIGNPAPAHDTYTLTDMSEASLRVLGSRPDIACVLVNPVQVMHPNNAAPADSTLVGSNTTPMRPDRAAYADWLKRLRDAGLPVQVANLSSIWTICYTRPSAYNWMFQYYLRAEGVALSWVGTGRLIFSLNYTEADFAAVADRLVAAAEAMRRGGWWWEDPLASNRKIKRKVLREMVSHRLSLQRARRAPG